MKRIKLLVFAICAMFVAAVGVSARELSSEYADSMLQLPENATGSDTYVGSNPSATIDSKNDNKDVTITFDSGKFKLVDKGGNLGIAAWPGIKILAPKNYNYSSVGEDQKGPVYYSNGDKSNAKSFKTNEDTEDKDTFAVDKDHYLYSYFAITEEFLKTAVEKESKITYYMEFDWNADDTIDQTITIIIDPAKVSLKDATGDNDIWNETIYNEKVKEVMTDVYDDLEKALEEAEKVDKSKYTEESVKKLEEAIKAAKAVTKNLNKNNQSEINALTQALTNAIKSLVVKESGSSKPSVKPEEPAPNTYDAGLAYVSLATITLGTILISVRKLRNN